MMKTLTTETRHLHLPDIRLKPEPSGPAEAGGAIFELLGNSWRIVRFLTY
jgi:hypothetical protein